MAVGELLLLLLVDEYVWEKRCMIIIFFLKLNRQNTKPTMESKVVELFPLPPDYYLLAEQEPRFLDSPPAITQDSYEMFGAKYAVEEPLPTLPADQRLFADNVVPRDIQSYKQVRLSEPQIKSIINELRRLHELMDTTYLALVDALCTCPDRQAELVEHIKSILVNIHYLMNTYLRPLQARSELLRIQARQMQGMKDFIIQGQQLRTEMW